jgi:hypothetical protein
MGAELHNITGVMHDIHDTFSGSLVRFYFILIICLANGWAKFENLYAHLTALLTCIR